MVQWVRESMNKQRDEVKNENADDWTNEWINDLKN